MTSCIIKLILTTVVFSSYLLLDPVWSHELNKRFVADYEDTHGQHCVDISEYTEPIWVDDQVECCEKKTKKMCTNHTTHRCKPVTETKCELVLYTECEMICNKTNVKTSKCEIKPENLWKCDTSNITIYHNKSMPVCKTEESRQCTQIWKTLPNGEKVKEITDDCQTVEWESCVLEPTEVPFDVPKVTCRPGDYYKTLKRVEVEQPIELNQMKCKVLETTACKPVEREVCNTIDYQECIEVLDEDEPCEPTYFKRPNQIYEHKEWCLFPKKGGHHYHLGHHDDHHDHKHHDHGHHDDNHGNDISGTGGNTNLTPTKSVHVVHAVPAVNVEASSNHIEEASQSVSKTYLATTESVYLPPSEPVYTPPVYSAPETEVSKTYLAPTESVYLPPAEPVYTPPVYSAPETEGVAFYESYPPTGQYSSGPAEESQQPVYQPTKRESLSSSPPDPLPLGWEQDITPAGEVYYLDHQTKSTSWEAPRAGGHVQKRNGKLQKKSSDKANPFKTLIQYLPKLPSLYTL